MERFNGQQPNNDFISRLRTPTPTILSGGAFSLACVFPTLILTLLSIVLIATGVLKEGYDKTDWWGYVTYSVTPLAFALVGYIYLKLRKEPTQMLAKKQCCAWKYYVVALAMQIGLFALSEVNGYFLVWLERFGYQPQSLSIPSTKGFGIVGVLFVVAVLPAVFEELIFRGAVLSGLKKNFSMPVAVLLCGGLFALYHQRPEQTLYQFCCGTAYALLALRAGSILPTMLAHFINNAVIIILYANGIMAIPTPIFIVLVSVGGVLLLGALAYLIFMDKSKPEKLSPTQKKDFFLSALPGILIVGLSWIATLIKGL